MIIGLSYACQSHTYDYSIGENIIAKSYKHYNNKVFGKG